MEGEGKGGEDEEEGGRREVRYSSPTDKSWIHHWSCNKISRLKNAV
jgi:hypothetical protein